MRHRIFIAINLPPEIKSKLSDYQSGWPDLPIRWVKKENLHLTLIFLGYISSQQLVEVGKITKEVASRHPPFFINLKKIGYGPPKKMPPRMIWVEGERSKELASLKNDLQHSLISGKINFLVENRQFTPHITLGRIRTWEWRQIEPEERPEVEKEISLSFSVNSIEIMESQLKKGGAEYTVLESIPLAGSGTFSKNQS